MSRSVLRMASRALPHDVQLLSHHAATEASPSSSGNRSPNERRAGQAGMSRTGLQTTGLFINCPCGVAAPQKAANSGSADLWPVSAETSRGDCSGAPARLIPACLGAVRPAPPVPWSLASPRNQSIVPEPSAVVLMATGLIALDVFWRRSSRAH